MSLLGELGDHKWYHKGSRLLWASVSCLRSLTISQPIQFTRKLVGLKSCKIRVERWHRESLTVSIICFSLFKVEALEKLHAW